jgi:hypothetical protein
MVMNSRRLMGTPQPKGLHPITSRVGNAALCITANLAADVRSGSWLCENSSARRARRSISRKLCNAESNRAVCAIFDALLENCIFYISPMYEFLHSQGHFRPSRSERHVH